MKYALLVVLLLLLFVAGLAYGAVAIPLGSVWDILLCREPERMAWQTIVVESRLPQVITAGLAGAALAVSGLLLQTLFRNPLAGPSILGISDGANLGVAAVTLSLGGTMSRFAVLPAGGYPTVILAAFAGACAVLGVILYFAEKVHNGVLLLIIGIMIGYLASSLISLLNFYATADRIQAFVLWGMGSFSGVSWESMPFFALCTAAGLCASLLLIKPLNALLLGEAYAANLGVRIKRARKNILIVTGLLTAVTTAFCGPIAFIGLAVPHVARLWTGSSNHQALLPVTLLLGACVALLCNLLTTLPGNGALLPLNAVTPLIGAPVIIYVIVKRKNIRYFD